MRLAFVSLVAALFLPLAASAAAPSCDAPVAPGTHARAASGVEEAVDTVCLGEYLRSPGHAGVVYVADGFKARAFVSDVQFFTYEPDFRHVRLVSDATIESLGAGDPMLPKAGSVLVQVPGAAAVYALVANPAKPLYPMARHLPSERVAKAVFGNHWDELIVEITAGQLALLTPGASVTLQEALPREALLSLPVLTRQMTAFLTSFAWAGYKPRLSLAP
ncbi:hypothetical protein A2856_02720 [Candidatus Uhrbacteria bacterium RIFCSPHIGHO2_01_FULL_63_20]|uniref:DUF4384 domain-containing protein n=1 Tax=Candidatus Uhrbacteria bacterium RIFCSPHIGHO2_01_FULL_63_20 TaxID=1802385 RepID=A0A1F7TLZ7_9BACT|nr:MAG: hypothetical protein A2856_02720 [Candidatus Uhrbacteria bacterium RIFCSPHIGHO2_01_FULL_63_20]